MKLDKLICQLQAKLTLAAIASLAFIPSEGLTFQIPQRHQQDPNNNNADAVSCQQSTTNHHQQLPFGNLHGQQELNGQSNSNSANHQNVKPNHRFVDKIKDARHRRRNRHNRNRLQQLAANSNINSSDKSLLALNDQPAQQGQLQGPGTQTLTALESIVDEVARAGQLGPTQANAPISGSSSQPVTGALQPSDILLENSSPPKSQLASPLGNPTATPKVNPINHPIQPQPQSLATRGQLSSRGFFLTSMLSKIMNVLNVTEFASEMRDGIASRASCMACNAVVGLFLSPLYSKEVFSAAIRTVCTSFKIQTPRVCSGLAEAFQDDFEYIRKNTKLTRDEVCGVVFGVDCARRSTYNLFWTVPIPDIPSGQSIRQPAITSPGSDVSLPTGVLPLNEQSLSNMEDAPDLFEYRRSNSGLPKELKITGQQQQSSSKPSPRSSDQRQDKSQIDSTSKPLKQQTAEAVKPQAKSGKLLKRPQYIFDDEIILDNDQLSGISSSGIKTASSFVQITDVHIDPYYETGALNDCKEPLCCRATSGPIAVNDKRRQAGPWGDYGNCDVPVRTLENALDRIRSQHRNAEYWIWTGDISPHDIWNISKTESNSHVRLVSRLLRQYSNGIPVFPVIGNHEAHPVNSFSPPEIKGKFSMSWLYDLLADEWSEWLPDDAIRTLRIGGFYKLQVRKGFRIIALNTNYCARLNPWSFYDPVDPANQLKWLVDELLEAELNQDKVHIIGHVPPDNRECTQAWLFNFINIVDRFKETILAQFYGHTHRDEIRLMYSMSRSEEPIGIQYLGPSITPFTENNPSYRVYHQDKSGNVLDSETYYFNLTEANSSPTSKPNWKFSYSTKNHLNMTAGLNAHSWNHYLHKLYDDDDLFDGFYKSFYRFSDPKVNQVCRAKCKDSMLSDLRLSHPYKTKPKPFFPNRKMTNHHRDRHDNHYHHHHHHKRLRHSDQN